MNQLENALLAELNRASGAILDDDSLLSSLERLKTEAREVEAKVSQTDAVMQEVLAVSTLYNPLSVACSRIYFAMAQMSELGFLYQFSLRFFLDAFTDVLSPRNPRQESGAASDARLDVLARDLFTTVYRRVARGLLNDDHLTFALRLAVIRLQMNAQTPPADELDFIMRVCLMLCCTCVRL